MLQLGYSVWQARRINPHAPAESSHGMVVIWFLLMFAILETVVLLFIFYKFAKALTEEALLWQRRFARQKPPANNARTGWRGWLPFRWRISLALSAIQGVMVVVIMGLPAILLIRARDGDTDACRQDFLEVIKWGAIIGFGLRLPAEMLPKIKFVRWCNVTMLNALITAVAWGAAAVFAIFFSYMCYGDEQMKIGALELAKMMGMMGLLFGMVVAITKRVFPGKKTQHGHGPVRAMEPELPLKLPPVHSIPAPVISSRVKWVERVKMVLVGIIAILLLWVVLALYRT